MRVIIILLLKNPFPVSINKNMLRIWFLVSMDNT